MSYQYRSAYSGASIPQPVAASVALMPDGSYRRWIKRALDIVLVLMVSLPVALSVALLALLVARDGHSPFYAQMRVGQNGRLFKMWKLRTMVVDADRVLEDYLAADPAARREWDHHQKLQNDPRITPVGRFLRMSSIDELPQLWNVLMGDMSLVGPRPMMASQRVLYPGTDYYAMRPGITGLWQVSERNETSFFERAEYDQRYFRQMSLALDVNLMVRTVGVVVKATGR